MDPLKFFLVANKRKKHQRIGDKIDEESVSEMLQLMHDVKFTCDC